MLQRFPPAGLRFRCTRPLARLCLLLPLAACAAPRPQLAANPPPVTAPITYSGTIIAVRPESSSQDPTGSLQQIMTILGQPAPQPLNCSEVALRLPDGTVKTSVQPSQATLAVGSKAAITATSTAAIQPN